MALLRTNEFNAAKSNSLTSCGVIQMQDYLKARNQQKIMMNVAKPSDEECWHWQGQISNSGYGRILLKDEVGNKMHSAHRASYELFVGEIGKDDIIMQSCGNRLCVNPTHLMKK